MRITFKVQVDVLPVNKLVLLNTTEVEQHMLDAMQEVLRDELPDNVDDALAVEVLSTSILPDTTPKQEW